MFNLGYNRQEQNVNISTPILEGNDKTTVYGINILKQMNHKNVVLILLYTFKFQLIKLSLLSLFQESLGLSLSYLLKIYLKDYEDGLSTLFIGLWMIFINLFTIIVDSQINWYTSRIFMQIQMALNIIILRGILNGGTGNGLNLITVDSETVAQFILSIVDLLTLPIKLAGAWYIMYIQVMI